MSLTTSPEGRAIGIAPASDDSVIQASLADPARFDELFLRHHRAVFRYAASRVGPDRADDIVSDTFLTAFANRSRFDASFGPSARPWLLGIATNVISKLRGVERQSLLSRAAAARGSGLAQSSGESEIAARLDAEEQVPALVAGLAVLPRRQRDALLLVALGGLTYDETAVALGVPLGTVQSRINRARKRLALHVPEEIEP